MSPTTGATPIDTPTGLLDTSSLIPRISIDQLLETSIRQDILRTVWTKWGHAGLPLDRDGISVILDATESPDAFDATDLLWAFDVLLSNHGVNAAGLFVEKLLPPSPLSNGPEVTWHERLDTYEAQVRMDAALHALSRSGANRGFILSAIAHKHFLDAVDANGQRKVHTHRVGLHLAKSVAASLQLKLGANTPGARMGYHGTFWSSVFELLSTVLAPPS